MLRKTIALPAIKFAGKTDIGLVRSGNEDNLHMDETNLVFAVCDGMGGHQAGEVASLTAIETLSHTFGQFREEIIKDSRLYPGKTIPPVGDLLLRSVRLANRAIHNKGVENPTHSGMGTTIVALAFEADVMSVAHVGDSRAYRITENSLIPLTRDHSWVAEMEASEQFSKSEADSMVAKNIITRALGVRESVEVDFRLVRVKPGDRFVLCSDGLCGFATDFEIFKTIKQAGKNLNKICDELIKMANDRGGTDNVTIIALEVTAVDESPLQAMDVFTLTSESPELLKVEDTLLSEMRASMAGTASAANLESSLEADSESGEEKEKGVNKIVLIVIFILFLAIAAFVIFSTQNP